MVIVDNDLIDFICSVLVFTGFMVDNGVAPVLMINTDGDFVVPKRVSLGRIEVTVDGRTGLGSKCFVVLFIGKIDSVLITAGTFMLLVIIGNVTL